MMGHLFGSLLFGSIGFVALVYGKRQSHIKAMILGAALMGVPYVVPNVPALYAIGAVLTAALCLARD